MIRVRLFCSMISIILLTSCGNVEHSKVHVIDSSYSYTTQEFETMCNSLKNEKISKAKLICKFKSKFDSASTGDITVFKFILWKYPEAIDTCWGFLQYKEGSKRVEDNGIICQ
jgi:hypothetical protein